MANYLGLDPFPDHVSHFVALWGVKVGLVGVAGGAALQAVSECPWRRLAGIFFF